MSHGQNEAHGSEAHGSGATLRAYSTGFVLALVLTLIPFGLVAFEWLPRGATLIAIAAAAAVQIPIHLYYFLHLDASFAQRNNVMAAVFTIMIMVILVGGTIWLFYSLHYRTMVTGG